MTKVADFGLAKSNRNTVTRGIGTPCYMPPEMFDEDEEPEKTSMLAVDIYALGVICAQLWLKAAPFENIGVHKIMSMVLRGKRPSLEVGTKTVPASHPAPPEPLVRFITGCWAQNSNARPTVRDAFDAFRDEVVPSVADLPVDISGAASAASEEVALGSPGSASPASGPIQAFLQRVGLERHADKLAEQGFAELEILCDKELLDDETLIEVESSSAAEISLPRYCLYFFLSLKIVHFSVVIQVIGMSKVEVRRLRALVIKEGVTPTMVRRRDGASSSASTKPPFNKTKTPAASAGGPAEAAPGTWTSI